MRDPRQRQAVGLSESSEAARPVPRLWVRQLRELYQLARARFGHQHWWPADTPFEVCVGAILTQNTAWTNVERALANLKRLGPLEPRRLLQLSPEELAEQIRPAGYFRVKTRRLRAFLEVLVGQHDGDLNRMLDGPTPVVRQRLLQIPGIGPETADSMLLYAGGHAVFVVDAYTRRIFARHGWYAGSPMGQDAGTRMARAGGTRAGRPLPLPDRLPPGLRYEALQALCQQALHHRRGAALVDYWQDYHAQLVMLGKHFCRARQPRCADCPIRDLLPAATRVNPATQGGGPVRER